jgi:imidazoleglycerol-phosphate dehydratase
MAAIRKRTGRVQRETRETRIALEVTLDGKGTSRIQTPVPFLNHMLELLAHHGGLDLTIRATGDVEVGFHHTVEDLGLCLGEGLNQCWGDLKGVNRYGHCLLPMDETLVLAALDISRRPHLHYGWKPRKVRVEGFDTGLVKEFFQALINRSGLTLHLQVLHGENLHHIIEALFKGFGRALRQAAARPAGSGQILSTKGLIG